MNAAIVIGAFHKCTLHYSEKCKHGYYSQGVYVLRQKIKTFLEAIKVKSWQVILRIADKCL